MKMARAVRCDSRWDGCILGEGFYGVFEETCYVSRLKSILIGFCKYIKYVANIFNYQKPHKLFVNHQSIHPVQAINHL